MPVAPRINEIQNHLITSIQCKTYNPVQPPTNTTIFSISRVERERLEICGDVLLAKTLIYYLYKEFPSKGANFISTIKAALLSNHVLTNILLKAQGYSDPNGFPVDKAIADVFETLAALSRREKGKKMFKLWFRKTFIPLVHAALCLWNRPDLGSRLEAATVLSAEPHDSLTNAPEPSVPSTAKGVVPMKAKHKKSWVEACMELAAMKPLSAVLPPCTTELPKRRRRGEDTLEEQPLPKRRWAEAMEAAGHENVPPRSNWVEAMARTDPEPIVAAEKTALMKQARYTDIKENCRPLPIPEPRRRRTRWDVGAPKSTERQGPVPRAKYREIDSPHVSANNTLGLSGVPVPIPPLSTELTAVQVKHGHPLLAQSSSIQRHETAFERDLLEPLHIDRSASVVESPPPGSTSPIREYGAGNYSSTETYPNCSPTKIIETASPGEQPHPAHVIWDASFLDPPERDCDPTADVDRDFSSRIRRRRSESLSSSFSSEMAISPCSSPTKSIFPPAILGREPAPAVTPTKQPSLDIHRGHPGVSGDRSALNLSSNRCPLTPPHGGTHNFIVAQGSTFWPGKTVSFTYKQHRKALQPALELD